MNSNFIYQFENLCVPDQEALIIVSEVYDIPLNVIMTIFNIGVMYGTNLKYTKSS